MSADALRPAPGELSRRLARLAFGLTLILSPFRASVLLVSRPVAPLYSAYTDLTLSWSEVALLATLGLWAVSLVAGRRPVAMGPPFLRWPLAGLLALGWVTVSWSIDPSLSAYNALELVLLAGFGLYVLNEIDSVAAIAAPLAIMVALQAGVGTWQVLSQHSVGLLALSEQQLDPSVSGVSVVATSATDRLLRAYGLTDHPNILGGVLALALPLLAVSLGAARSARRTATALALGLGTLALFLTFSRAAWLALVVSLAVGLTMTWIAGRAKAVRGWVPKALAAVVLGAVLLAPYGRYVWVRANVIDQTSPTEVMSTGERAILVRATSAVLVAHPITGTGLATLPLALLRTNPAQTFDFQPAPVVILDVAAEAGLLAGLCYGAVLVLPWVAMWRRPRRWTPELVAVSSALAALTLIGLFDYYTWTFAAGRIWGWLLLGLWARAYAAAAAQASA